MTILQHYPKVVISAAIVVVLLAAISLFRSDQPPASAREVVSTIFKDLVWQAEQLAGVLEDGDRVVALGYRQALEGKTASNYKPIFRALEKGGVSIQHIEKLVRGEEGVWKPFSPGFPYSEFMRVAEAHPDVDAVISLCGPPYFNHGTPRPDPSELPQLLVACGEDGGGSAEALFKQGWLHAATVPRVVERDGKPVITYELLRRE